MTTTLWAKQALAAATAAFVGLSFAMAPISSAADSGLQYVNRTTANGLGSNMVNAVYVVGANVYAATDAGLSISTNGGTSFTNYTTANGLGSNEVSGVFVVGSTIYASTKDTTYGYGSPTLGGLSISTDGGTTFTNKNIANGLGSPDANAVFVDGSTIYVGTSNTGQVISNAPVTAANITSNVATLTTSTAHGLSVGSIVQVSGVGITVDGDYFVTAVPSATQFSYAKTAADYTLPAPAGTAKLKASGGLSVSTNGGTSFTHFNSAALCGSLSCTNVRGIYASGSNIYLATNNHLVYSTNGGTTFTNAPRGELSENGVYVNGSTVYVATGFGVQYSTDYFATEPTTSGISAGLESAYVTDVYVNGGTLYASTWGGLGMSTNGGTSFTNDTTENCLGDDFVSGAFVSGGIIYVATAGGLSISNGVGAGCRTSGGGGGGGGGGVTSSETSEPTPTPTPTPVVAIPVVAAIPPGTNPNIPASGLTPGSSVFLVNGVPSTLTIKPNQPVEPKSLVATGDGFTMELEGRGSNGQPLGLTSDAALRLERGSFAEVKGTGFAPNSDVQVYLYSTTRFLGTIRTNASGAFDGSVPVPADVQLGRHTLQANALGSDNNVRSLSIGVVFEAPAKTVRTAKATVSFDPLSTELTPKEKKKLRSLAKKTKGTATGGFAIGFVQKDGNPANNASLSKQRARVIAAFLKANGVTAPLSIRGNGALTNKKTGRSATVSVSYTN